MSRRDNVKPSEKGIDVRVRRNENEKIQQGPAYDGIILKDARGGTVAVTYTIKKNKLVIAYDTKLNFDTRYTLTIPAQAVKDMAGNGLTDDIIINFTTKARR